MPSRRLLQSSRPGQYIPREGYGQYRTDRAPGRPFGVPMDRFSPQFQAFLVLCVLVATVGYVLTRALY